jgi:hypothetical protein
MNFHRVTMQLPHRNGGLGLTPHRASGMAVFYSASSTFVGWIAQRPHLRHLLSLGQCPTDPTTWTSKHT